MRNGIVIDDDGTTRYWLKGKLHRVDGPAEEFANGSKEWWFYGKKLKIPKEFKTMEDFCEKLNTDEEYSLQWISAFYQLFWHIKYPTVKQTKLFNDKKNKGMLLLKNSFGNKNINIPTLSNTSVVLNFTKYHTRLDEKTRRYYQDNDVLHRVDGPAEEYENGTKCWWLHGKQHRVDGPAEELADGTKRWFLHGKSHRVDGPAIEEVDGAKEWWLHGKQHRVDGPAIEDVDGTKEWWLNDELHRIDGPAEEWADGGKRWWVHGELHRVDGPAEEWPNGSKCWYLHGELHREDGPSEEYENGTKCWWLHGKQHRVDGPAEEIENGDKRWFLNGELHRVDGPAVELEDGTTEWFFHDIRLTHIRKDKDMEFFIEQLNNEEEYALEWINHIKGIIDIIHNPTPKQKRLNDMKWKL